MKLLLTFLVAGAVLGVVLWQRSLNQLEGENERLHAQQAEVRRMETENAHIERLRAENQEVQRLQQATEDLPKLRNEVRQLRDKVKPLPQLREENQKLRARVAEAQKMSPTPYAAAAPPLVVNQLAFQGLATPEAAVQTLFWALSEGDRDTLKKCSTPEALQGLLGFPDESLERMAKDFKTRFRSMKILGKKAVSVDELIIAFELENSGEPQPNAAAVQLKQFGQEWKVSKGPL